jgi:hypothetical protein
MKRSFNYTGRIKLGNEACMLTLWTEEKKCPRFSMMLDSEVEPGIDGGASIWIEAYRGPFVQRFRMGTWANPKNGDKIKLNKFQPGDSVNFRLKVVDETDKLHPVRAWKERLKPVVKDQRGREKKSILPVETRDLGHILWRLDWDAGLNPILLVNSRINEFRSITGIVENDIDWHALVFPEVVRNIMETVVRRSDEFAEEIEENDWIRFGEKSAGSPFPGSPDEDGEITDEIAEWIKSSIDGLAIKLDLFPKYVQSKK